MNEGKAQTIERIRARCMWPYHVLVDSERCGSLRCHIAHNNEKFIILNVTLARNNKGSLKMICDMLSKHVGAV